MLEDSEITPSWGQGGEKGSWTRKGSSVDSMMSSWRSGLRIYLPFPLSRRDGSCKIGGPPSSTWAQHLRPFPLLLMLFPLSGCTCPGTWMQRALITPRSSFLNSLPYILPLATPRKCVYSQPPSFQPLVHYKVFRRWRWQWSHSPCLLLTYTT